MFVGQLGIHAITGLVLGEHLIGRFAGDSIGRRAITFGFVLGNLIPDLDFVAVAALFPVEGMEALHLHRGFSHSLLAATTMMLGFYLASRLMQDRYMRFMGYGLSLGVVAHFSLDIFIWFEAVDIFWPASLFGIIPRVDIWTWWWTTPPLLERMMGAAELLAFGLYYNYLIHVARQLQTDLDILPALQRMANTCFLTWAVFTALAADMTPNQYIAAFYVPMGVIFVPACFYLTWRMQTTIEFLGLGKREDLQ